FFSLFFSFLLLFFSHSSEFSTLSLHDALPICRGRTRPGWCLPRWPRTGRRDRASGRLPAVHPGTPSGSGHREYAGSAIPPACTRDRKSTRLNSSHVKSSYAVFCLKKKNRKDM